MNWLRCSNTPNRSAELFIPQMLSRISTASSGKSQKTKGAFVSDDALMKQLYLTTIQITDKWTMPVRDWGNILMHLIIYFGDRVNIRT